MSAGTRYVDLLGKMYFNYNMYSKSAVPDCRLLFESESLKHASPSFVSRTAIFCSSTNFLSWEAVIIAWLTKMTDERQKRSLKGMLDRFVPQILAFTREHPTSITYSPVNATLTFTKLYEGVMASLDPKQDKSINQLSEKAFIFCALWAFAGCLDLTDREKMCSSLKTLFSHLCLMPPLSHGETYFDYYVDQTTGEWEHWKSRVGEWIFPTDPNEQYFPLFLVPTPESVRLQYLFKTISFQKVNIMITGTVGCAKSTLISQYLQTMDKKKVVSRNFSITGSCTAELFLKRFEEILEKRMGSHFGPPEGKYCMLIIEDLHQAQLDVWDDSPVLELCRQLVCDEGFYRTSNNREWIRVDDVQQIAVLNTTSRHRQICPRLKNKYSIFNMVALSDSTINTIFSKILGERLSLLGARNSVVEIALILSQSTISVLHRLQVLLQPSKDKVHYKFDLYDMARIFEGLLRCSGDEMMSAEQVIKVWRHECERAICDKLTTVEDQMVAVETISNTLKTQISRNIVPLSVSESILCHSEEMYGDFENEAGSYKPILDLGIVRDKIEEAALNTGLNFIVFDELVRHIVRLHRILGTSRGYAVLVGPSCSGKSILAQLASFLSTSSVISVQTESNQDTEIALQGAYKLAGLQLCAVTLIFSNPKEALLERINHYVRTGFFPDLISNMEMDDIVKEIRIKMGDSDAKSGEALIDRFIARARNSIKIIICLKSAAFKCHWEMFPMLQKHFAIDWILPWNMEQLRSLARIQIEGSQDDTAPESEGAANFLAMVHVSITQFETSYRNIPICVTPRHFFSLVHTFCKLYKTRNRKLRSRATEIDLGLQKLDFAGDGVAIMKAELEDKDSVLKFSQETTSALLKDISLSTMKTEKKKTEVMAAKNTLAEQAAQFQQLKEEYEQDVASAGPAMREAEQAIASISMKELATLKLIKNPPTAVKLVFDCVLIFLRRPMRNFEVESMGIKDSYTESWKLLQDPHFVKNLSTFPKESVNDETLELLAPYLEQKDFALEKMGSTSLVARSLYLWIRAICHHHELTRAFIPKIKAVKISEANLSFANKILEKSIEELNSCQSELDDLQSRFENAIAEKHRLNNHASKVESKISSAESLLHSLEVESSRWKDERIRLKESMKAITGDCCIASAYLIYLGKLFLPRSCVKIINI